MHRLATIIILKVFYYCFRSNFQKYWNDGSKEFERKTKLPNVSPFPIQPPRGLPCPSPNFHFLLFVGLGLEVTNNSEEGLFLNIFF